MTRFELSVTNGRSHLVNLVDKGKVKNVKSLIKQSEKYGDQLSSKVIDEFCKTDYHKDKIRSDINEIVKDISSIFVSDNSNKNMKKL